MAEELGPETQQNERRGDEAEAQTIVLTPKALEIVRKMHARDELGPDQGLRVGVEGGGCSGFQYSLGFGAQKEGDTVTILDGIRVFVDEGSLPYVSGVTLDYVEGLHGAGFKFDNPRAARTCGCGSSFGV